MFDPPLRLACPGLFVTGTDTGVGKTVVACAIAAAWRGQMAVRGGGVAGRMGVCKPFASGCRRDREGLVHPDAEALAHFADCRQPLEVISPIRFTLPLAPAAAAEQTHTHIDWHEVRRALEVLDASSDGLLIEGIGGLMVPLDPDEPRRTVLDLAAAVGYPVVVVARSGLGTLNHTAMTVRLLKDVGCRVAGMVMNGYDADVAKAADVSVATNRTWLERLTGVKVLATLPQVAPTRVRPERGELDRDVLDAAALTWWPDVARSAASASRGSCGARGAGESRGTRSP